MKQFFILILIIVCVYFSFNLFFPSRLDIQKDFIIDLNRSK